MTLKVYDVLGKEVTILVNQNQIAGSYEIEFDASQYPSGLYFYTININDYSQTRKMMLVK